MKLKELFEDSSDNRFYVVEKPLKVWALKGHEAANHYYGAPRLHKPVYQELELEPDDEIHDLVGGMFAVQLFNTDNDGNPGVAEKASQIRLTPPEKFSPFEKKSLEKKPLDNSAARTIHALVSNGTLETLKSGEQTKLKSYR